MFVVLSLLRRHVFKYWTIKGKVYSFFWVIPQHLKFMCRHFRTSSWVVLTKCSEISDASESAKKRIQQHSEQGKSLKSKVKGKFHRTNCHEGPEGEGTYSYILSLIWTLDGGGWALGPVAIGTERFDPRPSSSLLVTIPAHKCWTACFITAKHLLVYHPNTCCSFPAAVQLSRRRADTYSRQCGATVQTPGARRWPDRPQGDVAWLRGGYQWDSENTPTCCCDRWNRCCCRRVFSGIKIAGHCC